MFSRSAQFKKVLQKSRQIVLIHNKPIRYLSAVPNSSVPTIKPFTQQDIDKILKVLPTDEDNKLLIDKLNCLKELTAPTFEPADVLPVDVQSTIDTLQPYLTRFANFKKEVTPMNRNVEVQFIRTLVNLLESDPVFLEGFMMKFKARDLMHHIELQSVMRPGGNHCPDEYFELLFKIVEKSKTYPEIDIWEMTDRSFNAFFSGERKLFQF
jgi:hypothetical protein